MRMIMREKFGNAKRRDWQTCKANVSTKRQDFINKFFLPAVRFSGL